MLLVKLIMLPMLIEKFPYILWKDELGIPYTDDVGVWMPIERHIGEDNSSLDLDDIPKFDKLGSKEITAADALAMDVGEGKKKEAVTLDNTGTRSCNGGEYSFYVDSPSRYEEVRLEDCIGDLSAYIDIKELQNMHLMPKWMDDIADSISTNLDDLIWTEGYNKKTGIPLGNFVGTKELTNLMILDVSASIPKGLAATMLTLIDTLRTQANADLIVTGGVSILFKKEDELPSPQDLRRMVPRAQEGRMFGKIIYENYIGSEIGNLIAFGDNDSPASYAGYARYKHGFESTVVHEIWGYHTLRNMLPGYALWAKDLSRNAKVHINTDWVKSMRRN